MATPTHAQVSGNLTGTTQQGALTPVPLNYALDVQSGHHQVGISVEAGETKVVNLPTNVGGAQATPDDMRMFMLNCDLANVDVTLNSAGVAIGPIAFGVVNGMLMLPGTVNGLPISDISITNNGASRANLFATTIFGP